MKKGNKKKKLKEYAVYDKQDNLIMVGNICEIMKTTGLKRNTLKMYASIGKGKYKLYAIEKEKQ